MTWLIFNKPRPSLGEMERIGRNLEARVHGALRRSTVVLLAGPAGAGKRTLARAADPVRRRVSLDDAAVLAAALSHPRDFVAALEGEVLIEGVNRAPGLLAALAAAARDGRPGRFLATTSVDPVLLPPVSAGARKLVEMLFVWPLSQGELRGVREGFVDAVFAEGGLPEAVGREGGEEGERLEGGGIAAAADAVAADALGAALRGGYVGALERPAQGRAEWLLEHLTAVLQRDIRDLSAIGGLGGLPQLLAVVAGRVESPLNYAALSRAVRLPPSTTKRYVSLLEGAFLLQAVPAWSTIHHRRLAKSPKLLLTDTGLMAAVRRLDERRTRSDPLLGRSLLEAFVGMELHKQAAWSQEEPELYHFRSASAREVDFVLENAAGRVVGIQVQLSSTVESRDFRHLQALSSLLGRRFRRGVILYGGDVARSFGARFDALPLSALWRLGAAPVQAASEAPA
jgi:uncharacterized protein